MYLATSTSEYSKLVIANWIGQVQKVESGYDILELELQLTIELLECFIREEIL